MLWVRTANSQRTPLPPCFLDSHLAHGIVGLNLLLRSLKDPDSSGNLGSPCSLSLGLCALSHLPVLTGKERKPEARGASGHCVKEKMEIGKVTAGQSTGPPAPGSSIELLYVLMATSAESGRRCRAAGLILRGSRKLLASLLSSV